jgi:hypothetical protein
MRELKRNIDRQPKEGIVADKSSQLVLSALSRAAAAPAGLPLHGTKTVPGLFPTNAAGKQAAQRCQTEGYLCPVAAPLPSSSPKLGGDTGGGGTATVTKKKTSGQPLCTITEKGLAYLLGSVSPRAVLEDLVRAVEARQKQTDDLLAVARQMQQGLEALKANADKVLRHAYQSETSPERGGVLKGLFASFLKETDQPHATVAPPAVDAGAKTAVPHDVLLAELDRWQNAGASEDCPLPHLFRQLPARAPGSTIGQFHDALRQLHELGKIYLHPWTGPLYDIPEPPYALLVGHEIAYYASKR